VSVTSVVAPIIRLPGALLTCRELGCEQLHLSLSSLQTGKPLLVGLRLLFHGLNLLLKLDSVEIPPSEPGDSGNIHKQLEPRDMSKCLEGRLCTSGALAVAICYRRIIIPIKVELKINKDIKSII